MGHSQESKQVGTGQPDPLGQQYYWPITLHANVVTVTLDADALVMELRELYQPHSGFMDMEKVVNVPPLTQEDFRRSKPSGVVILTFSAACQLFENLRQTLPTMLQTRAAAARLGDIPK